MADIEVTAGKSSMFAQASIVVQYMPGDKKAALDLLDAAYKDAHDAIEGS
jgi:hypothetical protein